MKIQCDVCEKAAATVICCADEAALCAACDVDVHAANKLAGKHQRLPLDCLSQKLPCCDICQEKTAFIFCVEDRALFCEVCDEAIHVPGTLSGDHQRFLATGIHVGLKPVCSIATSAAGNDRPPKRSAQSFANAVSAERVSSPVLSPWTVDEFLQLSDYESSYKLPKESSLGTPELEWFADIGFFPEQKRKDISTTAAEVPQLLSSQAKNTAPFSVPNKSNGRFKRPRVQEQNDEDDFLIVPDLEFC